MLCLGEGWRLFPITFLPLSLRSSLLQKCSLVVRYANHETWLLATFFQLHSYHLLYLLFYGKHSQVVRYAKSTSHFLMFIFQMKRIHIQKKKPKIFPPRCFLLASSWSMIPPDVVRTTYPNCLLGRRLLVHFSISPMATSNLGEMTPHLFSLPFRLTTILPARWSSMTCQKDKYI